MGEGRLGSPVTLPARFGRRSMAVSGENQLRAAAINV